MTNGENLRHAVCAITLGVCWLTVPAIAAPVLRSADVGIVMSSPASCEVSMALVVEGGAEIDHRLEAPAGTDVDGLVIQGARQVGDLHAIGRTRSLVLAPGQGAYTLGYRVRQDQSRQHRCPLWLPTAAADGVSRAVHLRVTLPLGTVPGNTMPRFTWNGTEGAVTLGHLPAFVILPYATPGTSTGWNITAAMDAATVAVFVVASALWLWRKKVG